MTRAKSWPLLWAAILMPPKVDEKSFEWLKDLKSLPQVRARSVQVLSQEPLLHGALRWSSRSPGRIETLSTDGKSLEERVLPTGSVVRSSAWSETAAWNSAGKSDGAFRVRGEALDYEPPGAGRAYWNVPLGGALSQSAWIDSSKSWYGLASDRAEIFWLAPPYLTFRKVRWTPDAESVAFFPCDNIRAVLVENLPQGMTRFFFFRAGQPFAYTIFRFSENGSDVSAALARGCQDFVVMGSFGLRFVQYSRW